MLFGGNVENGGAHKILDKAVSEVFYLTVLGFSEHFGYKECCLFKLVFESREKTMFLLDMGAFVQVFSTKFSEFLE